MPRLMILIHPMQALSGLGLCSRHSSYTDDLGRASRRRCSLVAVLYHMQRRCLWSGVGVGWPRRDLGGNIEAVGRMGAAPWLAGGGGGRGVAAGAADHV